MAIVRDRPYGHFNFLVDLGSGNAEGPEAGFSEIIMPGASIEIIEYRNGNEKENSVRKISGLTHYENVVLKRGVIGSLTLYQWLNQIRSGDQNGLRNVVIQLQNEEHTAIVMTWKLLRARPAKYKFSKLEAGGKKVLVEMLELAYETLEME